MHDVEDGTRRGHVRRALVVVGELVAGLVVAAAALTGPQAQWRPPRTAPTDPGAGLALGSPVPAATAPEPAPTTTTTVASPPVTSPATTAAPPLTTSTTRPAAPTTTRTTVRVVPSTVGPRPVSATGTNAYRFVATDGQGRPARWDPCRSIRWAYSPVGLPPWGLDLLTGGFDRLGAATGLRFTEVGATTFLPLASEQSPPEGIDIAIAFTTAASVPSLAGRLGETMPGWIQTEDGPRIVEASMALDAAGIARLAPGFGVGRHRGAVIIHELGHVVGLNHISDGEQVMAPTLRADEPADYADGDRAGLDRLGAEQPCFSR